MRTKVKVTDFKEHEKGGVFSFMLPYGERISAFVFKDELPNALDMYKKETIHLVEVVPDIGKNGQPMLSLDLGVKSEKPLF